MSDHRDYGILLDLTDNLRMWLLYRTATRLRPTSDTGALVYRINSIRISASPCTRKI